MVKIEEQEEDDDSSKYADSQANQEASSSTMNTNHLPSPSPPQHNHDSPSSASSISSDHTFHGFSPSKSNLPSPAPAPVFSSARLIRDQPEVVTRTEPDANTGFASQRSRDKPKRPVVSVLNQARRVKVLNTLGLVLRLSEFIVSFISFSVMASDKRRGWALDSFDRYIEFRYSMTVNVISFAYSGLQGLYLLFQLTMGKDLTRSRLRHCIDFAMDQILAYLLLSSSSSAFTRVDDWISNWGKDKFPAVASASVGVSFLAFVAFALSSLISGYTLCTHRH